MISIGSASDLPRLRSLWLELHHRHVAIATYPTQTDDELSWEVRHTDYRTAVENDRAFFFVATDHATPVGYAMVFLHPGGPDDTFALGPTDAELYTLVVAAEHRSQGIGSRLFDAVEDGIHTRGITELQIGVMTNNTEALKFYETRGARPVETMLWMFGSRFVPAVKV